MTLYLPTYIYFQLLHTILKTITKIYILIHIYHYYAHQIKPKKSNQKKEILSWRIEKKYIIIFKTIFWEHSEWFKTTYLNTIAAYGKICSKSIKDKSQFYVKFRYSEKATKIWLIFHFLFDITQSYEIKLPPRACFSEYLNFTNK